MESQLTLPISYDGVCLDAGYRINLLVDDAVIVELKAVSELMPIHRAQLISYLKLSEKKLGLLINFNVVRINYPAASGGVFVGCPLSHHTFLIRRKRRGIEPTGIKRRHYKGGQQVMTFLSLRTSATSATSAVKRFLVFFRVPLCPLR